MVGQALVSVRLTDGKKIFKRHIFKVYFKGMDQWEWIGLWKVAIDRHLVRIVVIDVHFYFNLAAILE